jgi:hypothetical protein
VSVAIAVFGLVFGPMFGSGSLAMVTLFMVLGQCLIGMTYGPLGTLLSEPVPGRGALHRRLADLQPGRHPGRLAGALCGDLAGLFRSSCQTRSAMSRSLYLSTGNNCRQGRAPAR